MTQISQSATWYETNKIKLIAALGATALAASLVLVACSDSGSTKPAATNTAAQTPPAPVVAAPVTPAPPPAPAPVAKKKIVKKRPANVTYADVSAGISFVYPRQYTLLVGDDQLKTLKSEPMAMNFAQTGGTTLALLEMPKNAYPKTDFSQAMLSVNLNKGVTEEQCGQFAFSTGSDKAAVTVAKVKVGEREFMSAEDLGSTAANPRDARYYHLYENGVCYEFALGVDRSGSIEDGVTPVDRKDVFDKLEKVLASMKVAAPENAKAAAETNTQTN